MEILIGSSRNTELSTKIENFEEGKQGEIIHEGIDDGYCTPTSPKNRIPKALKCPPAPKKPVWRRLKKKRRFAVAPPFATVVGDLELLFRRRCDRTVVKAGGGDV
ncbi:hypothetical protein QJS10_CPA03g01608 [Acorus calamus]|uniref:Uncharacterized protein n=1 Tax=Acorus calamus TaxID=4465 RepID=A0AAV9F8D2_ACOCL|nr:hypothetical protein QJS10_CPA03g01608 [Acorus calamus]